MARPHKPADSRCAILHPDEAGLVSEAPRFHDALGIRKQWSRSPEEQHRIRCGRRPKCGDLTCRHCRIMLRGTLLEATVVVVPWRIGQDDAILAARWRREGDTLQITHGGTKFSAGQRFVLGAVEEPILFLRFERGDFLVVRPTEIRSPANDFDPTDRKSTRLNSSHGYISYAVFCLKKKNKTTTDARTS